MGQTQPIDDNGRFIAVLRLGTTEVVDGTSSSAASAANTQPSCVVRIVANADVNILISSNPTATTSTAYLPAGVVEYVKLDVNDKIAVLGGKLYITQTS